MAAITICSDFGGPQNSLSLFLLFPHLFVMKWWDQMPWSRFSECWVLSLLFLFFFFTFIFYFFKFYFIFKFYNIVLVLLNIEMNLPQVYICSPSWTLLPPPSPYHPSGSSQCTSPKHPVLCIEPGLATRFIHDSIPVSMPFSQIFPPSPSPTESIRLF